MHRRSKRKRQANGENDEGSSERRNRTGEDPSIVISDNDDVVLEEESILPKKAARPQSHRKSLAGKRNIANMSEEEQLALAVKISQQEQVNHERYKQEEYEEELLKQAIQESLNSCRVPDISPHVTTQELTNKTHLCKEYTGPQELNSELPLSQSSRCSNGHSQKSPIVVLKRLSQDIVESSSVILSPNHKCPVSYIESCKEPPQSPCSSIKFVNLSPCKSTAVSPVISLKSPFHHRLLPCRLFESNSPSAKSEIDDQCSHCSESSQLDSLSMLPTSESEMSNVPQNKGTCEDNLSSDCTTPSGKRRKTLAHGHEMSCNAALGSENKDTVHYYWGVPFCPKGVDPSTYTQVILCQLEVYQKSLKRAQRKLLHKMDYGQPIQFTGSFETSKKLLKSDLSQEDDTEEVLGDCDPQKSVETEREPNDSDCSETQSKRQKVSPSSAHISPEGDSSPSLKAEICSSQSAQELFTKALPGECADGSPRALGASAVSPPLLKSQNNSQRQLMEQREDTVDDEITICPETQPSPATQEDSGDDLDLVESITDPLVPDIQPIKHQQSKTTAETWSDLSNGPAAEDIECLEQVCPNNVECPLCGCTFSRTQIERHAAFCDGQQEMAALRPRHKLNKKVNTFKNHADSDDSLLSTDSIKYEKCYLCKSLVSLKDYQGHVDNCLQTAVLETEESPKTKSIKASAGKDGRLLRMLEKTESTSDGMMSRSSNRQGLPRCSSSSANPISLKSSSNKEGNRNIGNSSYMSPPREEQKLDYELLNVSDSPIRSFVSISEAKDCLVDFKKQLSHQPNNKRPSRRGGRRRRM